MFNFKARQARLRALLKARTLDGILLATDEESSKNPYYMSGFGGTTGVLAVGMKGAALAVDARYTLRAMDEVSGARVIELPKGMVRGPALSAYAETALGALNLKKGARIGFESGRVSVAALKAWKKRLPVRLIPTEGIVESMRQIKDAEELKHLARAAKITSDVFVAVSKRIRERMRESEIAMMLDIEHLKRGALAPSFKTIVASGKHSAIPHHETGVRKVRAGEPVVLDFGGLFPGGYCSDLTRTIFVPGKKPSAKLAGMYRAALAANKKAFRVLKPGITWKKYDAAARDYLTEKGYGKYFTHGLGHSIGLDVHDPYDYTKDPFQAGTVLSNEPGIYIANVGGIRIEDDVVVTRGGAKRLTRAPYLSL
jgi:Xaa-Pro aminopeptidase